MGDAVASLEEQLSIALQGLDQMLGDLRLRYARPEKSRNMPANDDDQGEQSVLRDRNDATTVARVDPQGNGHLKTTTEAGEEEEEAFRGVSSSQPSQSPVESGYGRGQTQDDARANSTQQQEPPCRGIHGARAPGLEGLAFSGEEDGDTGERGVRSSEMKDPPRLPDRLSVHPHRSGFVPTDPLPHPMVLGRITVLSGLMTEWKSRLDKHSAAALTRTNSGGSSVETYLDCQASLADSGAQVSSLPPDVCEKLGLGPEDYLPTKMEITGAPENPLAIQGVILASVQVGHKTTNQAMYVADNPIGPILSRKALIDLGILPKDFPCQQQDHRPRRPFADSTGKAGTAEATGERDGTEAELLQVRVQTASSLGTQRGEDLTNGLARGPDDTKKAHGRTTIANIDATIRELVDIGDVSFPTVKYSVQEAHEAVHRTTTKAGTSSNLGTGTKPAKKAPTDALSHDAGVRLTGQRDVGHSARIQEDAAVFHPSPGAGARSVGKVCAGRTGGPTNIVGERPEHRRKIGNGASARIFSLSTRCATSSTKAGSSRSGTPDPGGTGAGGEGEESIGTLFKYPASLVSSEELRGKDRGRRNELLDREGEAGGSRTRRLRQEPEAESVTSQGDPGNLSSNESNEDSLDLPEPVPALKRKPSRSGVPLSVDLPQPVPA